MASLPIDALRERLRDGPLGPHIDRFVARHEEDGYARWTIYNALCLLEGLSTWLERRRLGVAELTRDRIESFLRARRRRRYRPRDTDRRMLRCLLEQVHAVGKLGTPGTVDDGRTTIERDFEGYLVKERGVASTTCQRYGNLVRRFLLAHFGTDPVRVGGLRPSDIREFLLRFARTHCAKFMACALRAFFRFLYLRGEIACDLALSIPEVRRRRLASVPESLVPRDIRRLLRSCDRATGVGRRDYAVILLIARLGLRSCEVTALRLEDIRWETGELIVRGKGARQDGLPLPQDVGVALVAYLRRDRPACALRYVFVSARAPRRSRLTSSAIGCIVRRAIERAGLQPTHRGAHLLRHTLATRMLHHGASLTEIGGVLRHDRPSTTEIYAKVDLPALRELAMPWIGGVQ